MKKALLTYFIGLSFGLIAQENPIISGCFTNFPDSISSIKIAYPRMASLSVRENIPVFNGCFELDWKHPERGVFVVYIDGDHTFDFVISTGNVQFTGDYNKIRNVLIEGAGNDEFDAFKKFAAKKDVQEEQMRAYLLEIKDTALKDFLLPQILPLNSDTNVYWLRAHFWDYTNLKSRSTLINPFFENNRKIYFDQVLGHEPDTIIFYLNRLFSQPMDIQVKKFLVSVLTYQYETSSFMGEDAVFVWLANKFYNTGFADWMSKEDLAKIRTKSEGLATELIGNPAKNFPFDTRDGNRMLLSEVESPITILYFWSSECGHCRQETPKLKALYDEYKDRGVQVVAITLELELDNWNTFIEKYDLDWLNGFESDYDRPNFQWFYYIPSTPKKLILDANKNIIAKNLDIETTMRTFLDDYLAEETH